MHCGGKRSNGEMNARWQQEDCQQDERPEAAKMTAGETNAQRQKTDHQRDERSEAEKGPPAG